MVELTSLAYASPPLRADTNQPFYISKGLDSKRLLDPDSNPIPRDVLRLTTSNTFTHRLSRSTLDLC